MLQILREKTSGWIASVIMGLLIIPFAFFGVNNYFSTPVETWVAKVGEKEISQDEFRSRFESYRQQMRRMLGDNFDPAMVESAESKRRVLDGMVEEELMRQASLKLGLAVAPTALQKEIAAIPAFQVNGKFDVQQYRVLLATQNLTPLGFEAQMRADLQSRALPQAVSNSTLVSTADIDGYFKLRDQKRDLQLLRLEAPADDAVAAASDEQLQAYYEAHGDRYMSEEQVSIEYLIADSSKIEVGDALDESSLRARYDEQKERFTDVAQRLASHILIKVPADAPAEAQQAAQSKAQDLANQARAEGADFAALAREFSDDIGSKAGGGDLGWIESGLTDPAFESALFAMETPGSISEPVKSADGWHVIQLREVRPGAVKPFEAVRQQLTEEFLETERERAHSELAGKLVDITFRDPSTLKTAADELGLELVTTGLFGRAGGEDPVTQNPELLQVAFASAAIASGNASDPIELGEGKTLVLRVVEHKPSVRLPLDEVKDQLASDWRREALAKLADDRVAALLERLKQGESLAALATEAGVEPTTHAAVTRNDTSVDRMVLNEAFALARPEEGNHAFTSVALAGNVRVLVDVSNVQDGSSEAVAAQERDAVRQQMAQAVAAAELAELKAALKAAYPVQIAEERY